MPTACSPPTCSVRCPSRAEELRADAAIAFADLNLAYKRRFGENLCVVDSYRSLRDQQIVYYQRPGLAAIPGRSNHGLGLAIDFCGPIRVYKSTEFVWLEQNGKQFGWIHPDWAYVNPFEPWHWEYDPKVGSSSKSSAFRYGSRPPRTPPTAPAAGSYPAPTGRPPLPAATPTGRRNDF